MMMMMMMLMMMMMMMMIMMVMGELSKFTLTCVNGLSGQELLTSNRFSWLLSTYSGQHPSTGSRPNWW